MTARHFNPAIILAVVATVLVLLLQESVARHLSVAGYIPDIMLLLIVDWAIVRGIDEGMIFAFTGGILIDMYSGLPYGTSVVAFVVIVAMISLLQTSLDRPGVFVPILVAIVSTLLYYALAIVISGSINHALPNTDLLFKAIIGVTIYNAIINPFVFAGVRAFERKLHPEPRTVL